MLSLLAKIIPLDLASTLSPGIFALAVILLGGKWHGKTRTLALFVGIALVGVGITVVGFTLGKNVTGDMQKGLSSAIVDMILGAVFIYFGIKSMFGKEKEYKPPTSDPGLQFFKWLLVGFVIAITNLDALFLNFAAAKEVGESHGVNDLSKIILVIINLFFFTLPVTLPLFYYLISPKTAKIILEKINHLVLKYSKFIIFVLFVVFGAFMFYRGLDYFV